MVELVIAFAILAVAIMGSMEIVMQSDTASVNQKVLATRSRIIENLTNLAGLPASIRASVLEHDENERLELCVYGWWCLGETPTNEREPIPFRLYVPFIERQANGDLMTGTVLTGTPEQPIRYNYMGQICDQSVTECPIDNYPLEAFTEFTAVCPPVFDDSYNWSLRQGRPYYGPIFPDGLVPGDQCGIARYLKIKLTVRPSQDRAGRRPAKIVSFPPYEKTLTVTVREVRDGQQPDRD